MRLLESAGGQPNSVSDMQSICQDANGVFWGATQNGTLVSRINGSWKPVFTNATFGGIVTCVAADRDAVWLGTRNGKLMRIPGTNDPPWETNTVRGSVHGILASSKGDLWIIGTAALQRLHEGKIENIKLPRQVQGIYAIAEDAIGNIWIGANGILLRFDGTQLVNETSLLQISGRTICCLYCTDDGSVWIGSRGGGLMRLKDRRVAEIGLSQGLVNNYISQIVADGRGWLWFGSKHGIFKLQQSEVERAMEDPDISLRPIIYGKNEGLVSQEAIFSIASPFVLPRAILSSDRRVWMLMHTGIVAADPDALSEPTTPPPLILTQVAMDGHIIAAHDGAASTGKGSKPGGAEWPGENTSIAPAFRV